MNNNNYIIINSDTIQKRIDKIKASQVISEMLNDNIRAGIENYEIKCLEEVLSQSIPLIPEITKAYNAGKIHNDLSVAGFDNPQGRYINELKLEI